MSQTPETYYAHGKLLLTGEYFVLDGAKALALPLMLGQRMEVLPQGEPNQLKWMAYDHEGELWMDATYIMPHMDLIGEETPERLRLQQILLAAGVINPKFLTDYAGITVKSYLEFPLEWGLGSSSTLVYNIAQWAKVDAFELLKNTFGGSGYDIACAAADGPITFQLINGKAIARPVAFKPEYAHQLYFVYLGNKQDSREGIKRYKSYAKDDFAIYGINMITEALPTFNRLEQFNLMMDRHEQIVADFLELAKVKDLYFDDFPGTVKSLGAWGGDFVLAATDIERDMVMEYFRDRGYSTVLSWSSIVISS
ncbi:MAG: GYDIA family GHMP kinase [Chitinophagales bacterium]|nr:GYDIA family GHMP kinase [Chitinophagales bacterium]